MHPNHQDDSITPDPHRIAELIRLAIEEDLGPDRIDITSACLIDPSRQAVAEMRSRAPGTLAGVILLPPVAAAYDPAIRVETLMHDGDRLQPGSVVARFAGPLHSILAMERVALNFLTRLSGIATATARYVAAIEGAKAVIYDTRKTLPGYRELEKYAVVCGGGGSHRMGLYDAVLVKDNHIAHIPPPELSPALTAAINKARSASPPPQFVEVEVDTIEQLQRVLACPVDIVLLDNMNPLQLKQAVTLRNRIAPNVTLEASGGVTLTNVKAIAKTGVERIAIGAITHSPLALDLGLDITPND